MNEDFDIDAVLAQARGAAKQKSVSEISDALRAGFIAMTKRYPLLPGMLVTWKPGLRNKGFPEDGQPAIVMSVLGNGVMDPEKSSGSPYFREPLDVVVGIVDPDGGFLTFYVDGRRLMPFDEISDR